MDAISFVLGIKSSHLRSSHLRDLVYRGRVLRTSKINGDGSATLTGGEDQDHGNSYPGADDGSTQRSTQNSQSERGDPKTAWVMAVYEDDAGEEQLWKRTITNQGTSEYRINNRVVSAQQYNEALEAENILIKARNFLVFQGDVEAIASQSPRDLTRLVEQISGSLEYKAEYDRLKEAAEQAAENQTFHLNRRRGINSEIKQYQEQKKEADSYARKTDERDEAIVTHILWKLFHFQRVMDESNDEIQKHHEELKEFRRGLEKYETRLEEARRDQARATREAAKIERGLKRKQKEIEEQENGLVPVAEKIAITSKTVKDYDGKILEITREADSQSGIVSKLRKDLDLVAKAQAKWETAWKQSARQEGRELNESDLQEYKKLREQLNARASADQSRVDALARQLKTDEETVSNLKSKFDSATWQVQKLEEDIKVNSGRKAGIEDQVIAASDEINAKKKEFNALTSERLRTAQKQTELDEKLQEILRTLLEADDGRRQSEKELRMKETIATLKRIYPGVRGRVGELCKPKQKKYGDAVSTVLGRHFDSVIVDTEKTAKECIQYLRDQRTGQATFIPLDTIQVKAISSSLKGMHPGMRMAIDTIEYDHALERAMSYACGNAMICDDLSIAKYICYEKGVEAKAVTLDGTVIHKGGLMTGGRGPGQQNSRRWDESEVESLRKVRDKLLAELSALPKDNRRGGAEEILQGELTGLEQRVSCGKEEIKALERNLASTRKELGFAKRQLTEVQAKYEEKLQSLQRLRTDLAAHKETVSRAEDEIFREFCERLGYSNIRDYEAQQGSRQQEAAQKKLEFTMQKSKLESQLSFESQRLQTTQDRITRLKERSLKDEELLADLQAESDRTRSALDLLNAELDQLRTQLEEQNDKVAKKAEKVAERRRDYQKRSKEVEGTLKTIAGLEADIQRNAAGRYNLLRRCKLEEIRVPMTQDSANLDAIPIDQRVQADPDAMDVDEDPASDGGQQVAVSDYGVHIDFDGLDDDLKEVGNLRSDTIKGKLMEFVVECRRDC